MVVAMADLTEPNSYEEANRYRKVLKFLGLFVIVGEMTVEQVKRLSDAEWRLCANVLGVTDPSVITQTLIMQTMTDWASLKTHQVNVTMARSILGDIKKAHRNKPGPKGPRFQKP